MSTEEEPSHYSVRLLPAIRGQVADAAKTAQAAGLGERYLNAWRKAHEVLVDDPVERGDPLYRTRKQGGIVCQAVFPPLVLQYVVYQEERKVLITAFKLILPTNG